MGDGAVTDALRLGASVMIFCMLFSFALAVASVGRAAFNSRYLEMNRQVSSVGTEELSRYDNEVMLGDRMLYLAQQHRGEFFIRIATKRMPTGFTNASMSDLGQTDTEAFKDVKLQDSVFYVDLADSFVCTVYRNEFGAAIGLLFSQDGLSGTVSMHLLDNAIQAVRDEISLLEAYSSVSGGGP